MNAARILRQGYEIIDNIDEDLTDARNIGSYHILISNKPQDLEKIKCVAQPTKNLKIKPYTYQLYFRKVSKRKYFF